MTLLLFLSLIVTLLADCPLNHYPRLTLAGFLEAHIDSQRTSALLEEDYLYTFDTTLASKGVSVAIGINGFEVSITDEMSFKVINLPLTQYDKLMFRVSIMDKKFQWRSIKWQFFATQDTTLFSIYNQRDIDQFSTGLQEGIFSVYRILQEYDKFANQGAVIKVFLTGLTAQVKSSNSEQILLMENQLETMKLFDGNPRIIKLIEQALQIKKGLHLKMVNIKNIGKVVGFNVHTNLQVTSLSFSYILFGKELILEKHNSIDGVFELYDQKQHTFNIMSNMNMLFTGLVQFSMPISSLYSFQLNFKEIFNQGYFSLATNKPYFQVGFSYAAFQMQKQFVCDDCKESPHIYENKFCVQTCPRSFSIIQRFNNTYCEKCQIQKLKVVDPFTKECVCATRHYLNHLTDICEPCSYDCFTCSIGTRCLTCDNDNMETRRVINDQGRCVCPSIGYYDNSVIEDIVCQKCDSSCRTCNGPRAHDCTSCNSGKTLDVLGFCICSKGYELAVDGSCYCPSPKILSDGYCILNSTTCGPDQDPQFVDLSRRCVCKPEFVQVLDECIKCQGNSIFDQDSLACTCTNKTVYLDGKCVSCGNNQVFDDVLGICQCSKNSFKDEAGKCIVCPKGMGYINGRCSCPFNYYENNGKCFRCTSQSDGSLCRKNYI